MTEPDAKSALEGLSADEFLELLEKATPAQLETIAALGQNAKVNTALMPRIAASVLAAPEYHPDVLSILVWWERRRIAYNFVVGLCGLPTLAVLAFGLHTPLNVMVSGTLMYGLAANICYTFGTPAEAISWFLWQRKAAHFGPVLYTLGTIFSMCLTAGVSLVMLCAYLAFTL